MNGITGLTSSANIAAAGVSNSVNVNVLKDTQNLSQDLVNRLFSSIGLGVNFSGQG